MNERIHKIFKQARDHARRQQLVDDDFLEKFAELIIRECANIANKTVIGSDMVGIEIKKHFGVDDNG